MRILKLILLSTFLVNCGTSNTHKVSGGTRNEVVITINMCTEYESEEDKQRCFDIMEKLAEGKATKDDLDFLGIPFKTEETK